MKTSICEKVFVYCNLHKHCWSVKALEGDYKGRVIGHYHSIVLSDGLLRVSQAGRIRVLKEKRKNVHAGCQGEILISNETLPDCLTWREVTYNPYKYDSFVFKYNPQIQVDKFKYCLMENKRVFISIS